ncbi:CDP-diacylglycerol--serine O-phosphatidyltransferase [Coxiella endosymbiont of Amblyomma americanum]|uniref:CDP-diacylglycerol--serine O-phosphatidyltransferase n=1 Tax=Coxiella endosymbiont of Amblyomma americanum TaxID=325775 RepID=UPI00057D959F|nr:CDP-diacylglycerol--serine O-phosphatidyltransferase [Coxiella endosymbiont of Amblyomma americanum]AJC50381.1 CDP-diacylglycerol--serine O-phosphatidyltransferase [Coxiella endosymbiont of Amblyomma americanum]AUJ58723.1 CDP-diacylglycerol--serine O-phosphatidyltransferase [Coxiella-like endosymbiont of Amblyomma americanum]
MTEFKQFRVNGIYLLPNLFTVGAIFAGFYAIVSAMKYRYEGAAIAIFTAFIMDGLDGRVARLLNAQSEFGVQLDSLSDMISFGISPALVMYSWSLDVMGKTGWLVAFIYAVCTALRLARFNVQIRKVNKNYFQGLPAPPAAVLIASIILMCDMYGITGDSIAFLMAFVVIFLGLLMVSMIRYRSFKDVNLHNRVSFVVILSIVLVLTFIAFDPSDILLILSFLYVVSGPVETIWSLHKKRLQQIRKQDSQSHS